MEKTELLQTLLASDWFRFVLVSVFAFLCGLEYRNYTLQRGCESTWLNARSATLIGMLGFLFQLSPLPWLLPLGLLLLGLLPFLAARDPKNDSSAPMALLLSMVIYSFGLLVMTQPPWLLVLVFSATTFTLAFHHHQSRLATVLEPGELTMLAKFLLLAGVILPLLPDNRPFPWLPASPFKIWLGVVIISGISYFAYVLKKYLLKEQGYWVTGLLGGLYSSTATTVVLARKSRESRGDTSLPGGILAATAMMYLRLFLLVLLMKPVLLPEAGPALAAFTLLTLLLSRMGKTGQQADEHLSHLGKDNPLELGLALLFSLLFVLMLSLTQWVLNHYGINGLALLSALSGFTDIDPFVLSLLSGQYHQSHPEILAGAILIAAGSNNLLKTAYALIMGDRKSLLRTSAMLAMIGLLTIASGLWMF